MQKNINVDNKNIPREPLIAGILSFFCMGLGQAYNGQRRKGYLFFVSYIGMVALYFILIKAFNEPLPESSKDMPVTSPAYIITLICCFFVWVFNIYDAYKSTKIINQGAITIDSTPGKSAGIFFKNIILSVIIFFILMILVPILLALLFRK